jgi:hypothetical protein
MTDHPPPLSDDEFVSLLKVASLIGRNAAFFLFKIGYNDRD